MVMSEQEPPESAGAEPVTIDRVRHDVAAILDVDPAEILDTDNLIDFGLDSIRLMTLVQRWNDAGLRASFADLAEWPELRRWTTLLSGSKA